MKKGPGQASLIVPYEIVDITDSKGNYHKLQVAEIPEGYKIDGPVCQPFKLLATLQNNGETLVMTKYYPPTLRDRMKYLKAFLLTNNKPRVLNDIFVRGTIGKEKEFKELKEARKKEEKFKEMLEPLDYQDKNMFRHEQENIWHNEYRKREKCYDSGAVRMKPGKISTRSAQAIKENSDLKELLTKWN